MDKLDKLLKLAHDENIIIHYTDYIPGNLGGLYVEIPGLGPVINILNSIKNNKKEFTEVLAEEIGHYFTSIGDSISKVNSYTDKLNILRCENKANKWACEFLIREDELIDALNKNINCIHDLAEYLDVDVEILLKRLEYLALQKPTLRISDTKQLILTNLPNIYFYEDIYL